MRKMEVKDAKPYEAPNHFAMVALSLHGKESGSEELMLGLSHFLPGGGTKYEASPLERIYFVLDGEITVKTGSEEIVLRAWDSLHIKKDEAREIINATNKPASMLVVIAYPHI